MNKKSEAGQQPASLFLILGKPFQVIRTLLVFIVLIHCSVLSSAEPVSSFPDAIPSQSFLLPPPPWTPMGSTSPTVLDCQNCFLLTSEGPSQAGCLWDDETVDLGGPLDITVKMMFGENDAGADGICLILAASPDCGMYGADIGAGGIQNSIIFEFDTWDNGPGYGDLPNDHVSMNINGVMSTPLFGPSDVGNIEDGATHMVRFVWDGSGGFQIFLDGVLVLSGNYDFSSVIGGTEAFLGFSASTGGAWNNQIVCPEEDPVGPPDPAQFIEADLSVCANEQDVIYAVNPVTGVTYQWTAPPGATVNGNGATVTIDWGTEGGDVCVVLDNGCGTSSPVCVPVEVTPIPEVQVDPPGVICGQQFDLNDLVLNNLQQDETYSFHLDKQAAEAGTPALGNPPLVNTNGTYWIRVVAGDGCVQLIPVIVELEWLDLFVIQPDPLCAPGNLDLSFVDVVDLNGNTLTEFTYYLTQEDAEDKVNFLPGSTVTSSGSYWVRAETFHGCWGVAEILVDFLPPPDISVNPPPVQCAVDSFDLGTIDIQELSGLPPNGYTISFHSSAGAAVSGMPVIDPPIVNQAGMYWVRATNLAGCFDTASVALTFLETPSVFLTGGGAFCEGDDAILIFQFGGIPPFEVSYTNGVDTFTLSGSSTPLTALHILKTSVNFSILSFSDQTPPGCPPASGGMATFVVTPELKASPVIKICDQDQYSVTFVLSGGDSITWQVAGVAGAMKGDTFQSAPIASGVPFTIQVWDSTGCDTLVLTGVQNCDCLTDAGNFIETKADVCWTDTLFLTFAGNGVLEPDDIRQFVLHQGNGTILQTVLAWNDQPFFVFDPGTMMPGVTYYVSPIAGNNQGGQVDTLDLCLSVTPGIPVVFHSSPSLAVGMGDTICSMAAYDLPLLLSGSAPFTLIYQTNNGSSQQINLANQASVLSTSGLASATIHFLTLSDAYCTTNLQDSFKLTVNDGPNVINTIIECNDIKTEYTVTFQITGGDPASYVVTGPGSTVGNSFTSLPFLAGSFYSFTVSDQYDCNPVIVSGTPDCQCGTEAGSLNGGPLNICVGDTVDIQGIGSFLEPDDTLGYWLVADQLDPVHSLLWYSGQNRLYYPGLPVITGQVYYLFAVAGNHGNGGLVDTTDACLDISNGLAVTFVLPPQVDAILPSPVNLFSCSDTMIVLTALTTPQAGVNYTWTTNGGTMVPPLNQNMLVTSSPGWYTINAIENIAGCQDSAGIYLGTSVDQPQLIIFPPLLLDCAHDEVTIDASQSSSGANYFFQWSSIDGQIISGANASTVLVNQPGTYQLEVLDLTSNCSTTGSVLVLQDTLSPLANAGVDQLIPCSQTINTLDGTNSYGQGMLSFVWATTTGSISGAVNQAVMQPNGAGEYVLTVTDSQNGCTDSDEVIVTLSGGMTVSQVAIDPPRCYGEASGQIAIDGIAGGQGPYQAMLGSVPFSVPGTLSGLKSGTYPLLVTDALGCQWDSTIIIDEPQVLAIDLGLDLKLDYGSSVVLIPQLISPGSGIVSYVWSTPDSILCVGCPSYATQPTRDLFISLEVEDLSGCLAHDDIVIRVFLKRKLYIPNSFSPNLDGINDVFAVYGGETVDHVRSMAMFDRWGNSLFYAEEFPADGTTGWDGRYRDQPMDPGVYVYVVEIVFIDGSARLYKGDLQLMK